ncbi:RNA dependent RNA polymerase [Cohnella terricola]|nr:hypothetical protein [Cohnella terricola]
MSLPDTSLTYVLKIRSSRLRKAGWHLENYTLKEARRNEELVAIADSQTLRFIREIKGIREEDARLRASRVRQDIRSLQNGPDSRRNGAKIAKLYENLYSALFMSDYLSVIMDSVADFDRVNSASGFLVNGTKYRRLLATPGGVKKNTVVYVSEDIYPTLAAKLENGRKSDVPLVPAKYEAYKALACSASKPVPGPAGILVVKDCRVPIVSDVVHISEEGPEPTIREMKNFAMMNNNSDGYGLISPELSRRWADALGLDYMPGGFCIRNAFTKGMLYTFDYRAWSREVARSDEVVDVWGTRRSAAASELVLTESMLKLWHCYDSMEHFLGSCEREGYTFSVTKTAPNQLDNERDLNYQFIQSLDLTDGDIDELIAPTMTEIKEALGGDYRKTLLFLKGMRMDESSYEKSDFDFAKALMIDKDMVRDPYVRHHVHKLIAKRIQGAKMGEIRVKGNYSLISGDPYALCQSMFGLKVTGLLAAGQFYQRYWSDRGISQVAAFRAPMTCHSNIRVFELADTPVMRDWYKHMGTVTIFNAHDTTAQAMNGADMDGDAVFTTNNPAILRNVRRLDAIVCEQKSAPKKTIAEADLIRANKLSFGDRIGSITNRITAMYDVLAKFSSDSEEYRTMAYRILCGQNYQQNAIDRTKGIESRPMPKGWYDYRANLPEEGDNEEAAETKKHNRILVAEKKPYFMIYRYPELKKDYDNFIGGGNANCRNRFGCTVEQLTAKNERTEDEEDFLRHYRMKMPVSMESSVMNRLCRKVEEVMADVKDMPVHLKGYDYSRLKSGVGYRPVKYKQMADVLALYQAEMKDYMALKSAGMLPGDEDDRTESARRTFLEEAYRICGDANELCDIVVDLCYKTNRSKQFAWDVAGETIIGNLLKANDYRVSYPILDPEGDIVYRGEHFAMHTYHVKGADSDEFGDEREEGSGAGIGDAATREETDRDDSRVDEALFCARVEQRGSS